MAEIIQENATYLIWSNEHRRWWGPSETGYVFLLSDAGHYTRERAMEIVRRAQDGRGRVDAPAPEIMVRLEDAQETLRW